MLLNDGNMHLNYLKASPLPPAPFICPKMGSKIGPNGGRRRILEASWAQDSPKKAPRQTFWSICGPILSPRRGPKSIKNEFVSMLIWRNDFKLLLRRIWAPFGSHFGPHFEYMLQLDIDNAIPLKNDTSPMQKCTCLTYNRLRKSTDIAYLSSLSC